MLVPLCRHFVVSMGVLVPKRKPASLAEREKKTCNFYGEMSVLEASVSLTTCAHQYKLLKDSCLLPEAFDMEKIKVTAFCICL